MNDSSTPASVAEVCLYENALPTPAFERLATAVRELGSERMKGNGSYTTTFWFPCGATPKNFAEQSIVELLKLVQPGPACIGTEWWLGRLGQGKTLRHHFDRDLALEKQTGETVHPLLSSVLYLNDFPGSPTVILDQVLAPDGKTKIPEEPEYGKSIDAVSNHYVVFPGNLRHGVIPTQDQPQQNRSSSKLRMTLLVNYWHRRPLAPICCDYDGSIYASLQGDRGSF